MSGEAAFWKGVFKLRARNYGRLAAAHRKGAREAIEAFFEECRRAVTEYAGKTGPTGELADGIYVAMGIGVEVQKRYAEPQPEREES